MGQEIYVKRTITIEETKVFRDLPAALPAKPNVYHWLSEHIVGVTLVALALLAVIAVLGIAIMHTYHILERAGQ